ncbi:hypothetical protein AC578_2836 [Pseudocercospora eumusae]|uniref:Uncharacterized protein n=1 Tax=Pseudocercospora eumusae TaxID=321146 RepID=A0A139H456_9PEZI|nr:hypothetical protein AC578_2836 [Pseudocercospora eumusae]
MAWDWTAVNTVMERNKSRASSRGSASPPASDRRHGPTTPTPRPLLPTSLSHHSPRPSAMHDAAEATLNRTPIPKYPDSLRHSPTESHQARSLPTPARQSVALTSDSSAASTPHSTPTRAPGKRMTSNERTQRYTPSRSSPLRVSGPSLDEQKETSHSTTESWSKISPRADMRSPAPSPNIDAGSLSHVPSRSAEHVHPPFMKHVTGTAAQRRSLVSGPHIQETAMVDRKPEATIPTRTTDLLPPSLGFANVQGDSLATDARTRSSRSASIRDSLSSPTRGSHAAVQRPASETFRSGAGFEHPMFQQLPVPSRGESKSAQILQPKLRKPSRSIDLQNGYDLPEEYSAVEDSEQTWGTDPGIEAAAAARTLKPRQAQPVPGPSYLRPLDSPSSTNEPHVRTSNVKFRIYCGLFFFIFVFLTLPFWIPYVERITETQAVLKVEAIVKGVRSTYDPNSTNSTAAKFNLHAQICQIDSIRCNIVHHEPQMRAEFFQAMVLRYQSDQFDPPCPAVGCLGRPAPALPAAIEQVVGDLFANVSSELVQLDGHFVNLERVLHDCALRQEPLLELLQAIVGDWTREQSLLERCDRLLQRARTEEEEKDEAEDGQQGNETWLAVTLHQATIQSCKLWMFAHKAAVTAGVAQELALVRWKTIKKELETTMRQCNKDLENNWLAIAATGDRCRDVARELDRLGLRQQLPDSAVQFLETKLTCSGAQLAKEFSRRVSSTLGGKMALRSHTLPDRAPIAAPFHPWSSLRNGGGR